MIEVNRRAFAADYLQGVGLSFASLTERIKAGPDTALVITGSIAAARANSSSDIDVCALGEASMPSDLTIAGVSSDEAIVILEGERKLCLETWSVGALEALARKMKLVADVLENAANASRIPMLGEQEVALLHELRSAIAFHREDVAARWAQSLRADLLPRYLLLFAVTQYLTCKEDAIAQCRAERWRDAAWIARHGLDKIAIMVLASCVETNPRFKWRLRLLDACIDRYESGLVERLRDRLVTSPAPGHEASWTEGSFKLGDAIMAEAVFMLPGLLPPLLRLGRKLPFDLDLAQPRTEMGHV